MSHIEQSGKTVSVALCTYNGEEHIGTQLESLASQTHLPLELVVCDDGSTDNTLDVVADFAKNAPFPVSINRNATRLGYANNFLHAGSLCSGHLVAFADQDDVWAPSKLNACLEFFDDPQVLLTAHSAEIWDGQRATGKRYPHFSRTEMHSALTLNPFHSVPGFAIVMRRSLLELEPADVRPRDIFSLGKAPEPMAHDQWVWFLATTLGKVATIAEPQVLYRQHAANVVGAPRRSGWRHRLELTLSDFDYAGIAKIETEAVQATLGITKQLFPAQEENGNRAVHEMRRRAHFHLERSRIYDQRSRFITRCQAFSRILRSGGYRDDAGLYRLGHRAALKDVVLGLTGIFRVNSDE